MSDTLNIYPASVHTVTEIKTIIFIIFTCEFIIISFFTDKARARNESPCWLHTTSSGTHIWKLFIQF